MMRKPAHWRECVCVCVCVFVCVCIGLTRRWWYDRGSGADGERGERRRRRKGEEKENWKEGGTIEDQRRGKEVEEREDKGRGKRKKGRNCLVIEKRNGRKSRLTGGE